MRWFFVPFSFGHFLTHVSPLTAQGDMKAVFFRVLQSPPDAEPNPWFLIAFALANLFFPGLYVLGIFKKLPLVP